MIKVDVIGSGSSGNCYHVTDGETRLLLECGLPWKKIQKALNFDVHGIEGVLVSHEHGDHSHGVPGAIRAGLDVYMSAGTANALGVTGHRVNHVEELEQFKIGSWRIVPFRLVHDAVEPMGFFLGNRAGENMLFITDTAYCRPRFAGITHLMVECNFCEHILADNVASGRVEKSRLFRLERSHFSIQKVLDFIAANDMRRLQQVWLMHLSDANSDAMRFKREVQALTGVPVEVC